MKDEWDGSRARSAMGLVELHRPGAFCGHGEGSFCGHWEGLRFLDVRVNIAISHGQRLNAVE
jgi:hypothetical protein